MNPVPRWRSQLEQAVMLLGLLAFWPAVIGYTGWIYQVALFFIALALGTLAFVRYRRLMRAMETERQTKPRT